MYKNVFNEFPELIAVFSDRNGGVSKAEFTSLNLGLSTSDDQFHVKKNRDIFFSAIGINDSQTARIKQVHGKEIIIADHAGYYGEADAIISNVPGLALCILVADCAAILLYDAKNKVIAAIHSGWRGTLAQILIHTVNKMIQNFQSYPEDLHLYLSPCLSQSNFEVGDDVFTQFESQYFIKKGNQKYFFNMRQVLLDQAHDLGIKNIENDDLCSYASKQSYFSYRRDKEKSGRMMAVIMLKKI
jgi:YfiH family protein